MIRGMEKKEMSTRQLTIVGMLGAISAVLGFTPLGFITVGAISVTTMHIPVIVGAILEGPMIGMMVGLLFGLISMVRAFLMPTPTSFIFWNPLISILPRILIGYVTYQVYFWLKKGTRNETVSLAVSAFLGTLTNTVGVLGLGFLLYGDKLAEKLSLSVQAVGVMFAGVAVNNGIPEAILSVVITLGICKAMQRVRKTY